MSIIGHKYKIKFKSNNPFTSFLHIILIYSSDQYNRFLLELRY